VSGNATVCVLCVSDCNRWCLLAGASLYVAGVGTTVYAKFLKPLDKPSLGDGPQTIHPGSGSRTFQGRMVNGRGSATIVPSSVTSPASEAPAPAPSHRARITQVAPVPTQPDRPSPVPRDPAEEVKTGEEADVSVGSGAGDHSVSSTSADIETGQALQQTRVVGAMDTPPSANGQGADASGSGPRLGASMSWRERVGARTSVRVVSVRDRGFGHALSKLEASQGAWVVVWCGAPCVCRCLRMILG